MNHPSECTCHVAIEKEGADTKKRNAHVQAKWKAENKETRAETRDMAALGWRVLLFFFFFFLPAAAALRGGTYHHKPTPTTPHPQQPTPQKTTNATCEAHNHSIQSAE
jgi:hypothetical protein